jgi:S-formylglutathione hydrolase FrmB
MVKRFCILTLVLFVVTVCFASRVETIEVASKAMHKTINNIVILPDGYDDSNTYPVVYLLHGATGNYKDWVTKAPVVQNLADQYHVIVVCPDGGFTSWYFDSPVDSTYKYETYVTKELLAYVDSHFSTVKDKSGRAITGLSMGGHGGLYLGFRHQDIFGVAGSMSGGVDIRPFPNNWDIAKRLGTLQENPENWEKNSVVNMVDLLEGSNLKIIFDCGYNDFFYEVNINLHNKLVDMKYPHDFIVRPGVHNWVYWSNAVKYQFLYFSDFFNEEN